MRRLSRVIARTWPGALVGVIGCAVVFRAVLGSWRPPVFWADEFDARLVLWIAEWGFHALVESGDWRGFFDANSFYPHARTLAYSESLLSLQLLYAPLRALGVDRLDALYVALAGFTVLGTTLSYAALTRIDELLGSDASLSRLEKSFIVVAAHWSLCVTGFLVHYQLFGFHLAIPFLLYLFVYLERWRRSDLIALCLVGPLAVCFAGYLAPFLLTLSGLLAAARFARRPRELIARVDAHLRLPDLLLVVMVAAALYAVAFRPYLLVRNELGRQSFADTVTYSARPASILVDVSANSALYPRLRRPSPGDWERAVFPGATLLIGGVALAVLTVRRGPAGSGPMRRLQAHAVVLLAASWVLSLGPYLPQLPALPLPFAWLSVVVPGLREVRAPGRLGMFFALPLAIFAVVAIRSAFARHRRAVLAVVLALFIVESWPVYPVYVYALPHEKTYRAVAERLAPRTPLLELPAFVNDHFGTLTNVMNQLLGSTYHWARLVVGYGAKSTPEYHQLLYVDWQLIQGQVAFPEMIRFARGLGIEHVLIHFDGYPAASRARIRAEVDATPGLEPLHREGGDLLVRLR